MKTNAKVALLIPFNNIVPAPTTIALIETILGLGRGGHEVTVIYCNDTYIGEARMQLAKKTVEYYTRGVTFDYVVWIDSDQTGFDDRTITRLCTDLDLNQFDILSAVYYTRDPSHTPQPVALRKDGEGYRFLDDYTFGIIEEVDAIGMGMVVMHHGILEQLLRVNSNDLFSFGREPNGMLIGEDVQFCKFAQAEGYKIGLDTWVQIGHAFSITNQNTFDAMKLLAAQKKGVLNDVPEVFK